MSATKTNSKIEAEARVYKALSHPVRFEALIKLNERAMSPSELAEELDHPIGTVAYHVRTLVGLDAVELVETKQVRGAVEHFYRASLRPYLEDEHWSKLPLSMRRRLFDGILQDLWEHAVEGAKAGGFDVTDAHVSWTSLELDSRGRDEMATLLNNTVKQALQIHAGSAGRLVTLDEAERDVERSELAVMHYLRPRPEGKTT